MPEPSQKYLSPTTNNQLASLSEQLMNIVKGLVIDDGQDGAMDPVSLGQLEGIADELESVAGHVSYTNLRQFNIVPGSNKLIINISNLSDFTAMSELCGENELWSSNALYRHLKLLNGFVTSNEAGARMWIDAFFFRVQAMLNQTDKSMVLSLEQHVELTINSSTKLGGFMDYVAVRGSADAVRPFLQNPDLKFEADKDGLKFFVVEAKKIGASLQDSLLQAVGETYACGKVLGKQIVRGTLTDGQNWIFFLVKIKETGGATYYATHQIRLFRNVDGAIVKRWCDIVAGIMAHWIENTHKDLDGNDWITYGRG